MIPVRQLLTGVGVGALVALLVHELFEHGMDVQAWSVRGPQVGRMLVAGALIGAISQLFGQTRGRR